MKIIGKTTNGFILEATGEETANLIGKYGEYDEEVKKLFIGSEIRISPQYHRLHELLDAKDKMGKIRNLLTEIQTALEPAVKYFDKAKEDLR